MDAGVASGENYGEERTRTDWFTVALLFLAGIGSAMHFAKIPAALPLISTELGLSTVGGGLAVSLVAVMGIVLGVAAGALVDAWGRRRLLLVSLVGGAVTSALIPLFDSTGGFLALRVVEGLSHLVIVVAAPSLMGVVARPADRPLVMTIWGAFFAVGFAVTDVIAPGLLGRWGWPSLFHANAVLFAVTAALLWPRLNRLARLQTLEPAPTGVGLARLARDLVRDHGRLYRHLPIMFATGAFVLHCLLFNAYLTYVRQLLVDEEVLDGAAVGPWMSLLAVLSIVSTLVIGGALLRFGVSPFRILVGAFVCEAVAGVVVFAALGGETVVLTASIVLFVFDGLVQGATFATIPVVASDRMAALAHGAFAQGGNVGSFAGPPLFAAVLTWTGGWAANGVVTAVGCAAGVACTVVAAVFARRAVVGPSAATVPR
ncbi:putative arabinose efflux permease, MFS family [Streptoalloteichus tenebrarius]|uniref:Arabinose efflux permease, MFS family n=1 Tax=Streptoalloteichus tenebrarius (strain ATCC 17920 / DSM 40477 / JCM 4838 / CBS 697.72 / NBRC 16177 / NCIMB 11028 / NRRL B-12390 / A12253. 1 / ISP 5477) TaxID=1933 RepID=A0ABT1HPL5_STRSD|nr:MFS transporter [Streptoalloteichus tenebrarius]MCP2257457.1 putative arabinose efflux permease, MFS family [Streptoalloteichus tenebrarius]BFE98406.1 MFS transporter [Streptoalloteichus tenebrarius]